MYFWVFVQVSQWVVILFILPRILINAHSSSKLYLLGAVNMQHIALSFLFVPHFFYRWPCHCGDEFGHCQYWHNIRDQHGEKKKERIFKKNTFKTKPGCFYYVIMFWTREPDEHFAPEIFSSWYFLCWLDKMAVATERLKPSLEILYLVI